MARKTTPNPTEAEFEILNALWDSGPSTLGEVWSAVRRNRPVARTTVATTLGTMLRKGLVRREHGPQAYVWAARRNKETTARQLARQMLDQVFEGSARRLMLHLIDGGELSEQDLDAIGRLAHEFRKTSSSESKP
jgi:BlaI family penicillinase repressor